MSKLTARRIGIFNRKQIKDYFALNPDWISAVALSKLIERPHCRHLVKVGYLSEELIKVSYLNKNSDGQSPRKAHRKIIHYHEFPEVARQSMKISKIKGYTPLIYWLAIGIKNTRYDNKYKLSVAPELGIAITDYTRDHAQTIIALELRITQTLSAIASCLNLPEFDVYNAVFNRFGFGLNVRALLLFNLYPFEKLLVDGKPWVEYERQGLKLQKRPRSLRKFQAFCGLSYSYKQSGDKVKRKFHGNGIIRSHLYIWAVCTLSRTKNIKHNALRQELSDRYQELRKSVKGKDALTRILFKLTRMLFYEFVKELRQVE
ncbi:MAG: transposase [Pleurocapsa minor HA4230-MV1]|jgi:hypothetical protein|nr:transposase [Pleurocapsa minor HA4230-MV1]